MMKQKKENSCHLLTEYPFTFACIVLIWVLSFITPPQTPLEGIRFIDKWTHLVMYGGTTGVLWTEHIVRHGRRSVRGVLLACLALVVMSGCIELLQEYCTGGRRSGDWFDLAANSTGVVLGIVCGAMLRAFRRKR